MMDGNMSLHDYANAFIAEYPKRDGAHVEKVEEAIKAAGSVPPWREMRGRIAAFRAECMKTGTLAADGTPCERTRYIPNADNFISTGKWRAYAPLAERPKPLALPTSADVLRGSVAGFVALCVRFGENTMRGVLPCDWREQWDALRDAQRRGALGSIAQCPLPLMCALGRKVAVEIAERDATAPLPVDAETADYMRRSTIRDVVAGFLPSRYASGLEAYGTAEDWEAIKAHAAEGWDKWHDTLAAAGF